VSFLKIQSGGIRVVRQNQRIIRCDVCDHPHLLATFIADLFKPRRRLEVENLFPRHQPPKASPATRPVLGQVTDYAARYHTPC
jgi:hypothetical protein